MPIKKSKDNTRMEKIHTKSSRISQTKVTETELDFIKDKSNINRRLMSIIHILSVKNINTSIKDSPIELNSRYAKYLQFLEIRGKDIGTLSEAEQKRTIASYTAWLDKQSDPLQFEVTTLPTDTTSQVEDMKYFLDQVNQELNSSNISQSRREQLKDRASILADNIYREEQVMGFLYNTEFILWIFSDTLEDLQRQVRQIRNNSSSDFQPTIMSAEKKEQVITQYYNQNEKVKFNGIR